MIAKQLSFFSLVPQSEPARIIDRNPKRALKLRALADAMQSTIERKMNPATAELNPTARRARIIAGMRQDGKRLEQIQAWLYALASLAETGDAPNILQGITTKKQLEVLQLIESSADKNCVFTSEYWAKEANSINRAGIDNLNQLNAAIAELTKLGKIKKEGPLELRIKNLELNLIGSKISGYFNTPSYLCERMARLAHVLPGDITLEPSSGKGSIAEFLRNAGAIVHCCEVNFQLREILSLKGFELVGKDILEYSGFQYRAIVMNPPFDKQVEHILHCFNDLLQNGGRLVAIVSEGIQFRSDNKHIEFRKFLDKYCVLNEPLPDGTFLKSDNLTGVKTRLLILQK